MNLELRWQIEKCFSGPLFKPEKKWERMDKDDALLTVTLRTNMGPLGLGYNHPLAMYDFIPNGGEKQPGCGKSEYLNVCIHNCPPRNNF